MAINEINTKEQKKAERKAAKEAEKKAKKAERAEMKKSEKLEEWGILFWVGAIIFGVISIFSIFIELDKIFDGAIITFTINVILCIIFYCLSKKEAERERRAEVKRKESLIAQLNKKNFREIKLKKTENKFFNAFLNNGVQAKIHEDNDEIINVELCFCDNEGAPHYKVVPFSRDYLLETIEDVIDIDSN